MLPITKGQEEKASESLRDFGAARGVALEPAGSGGGGGWRDAAGDGTQQYVVYEVLASPRLSFSRLSLVSRISSLVSLSLSLVVLWPLCHVYVRARVRAPACLSASQPTCLRLE